MLRFLLAVAVFASGSGRSIYCRHESHYINFKRPHKLFNPVNSDYIWNSILCPSPVIGGTITESSIVPTKKSYETIATVSPTDDYEISATTSSVSGVTTVDNIHKVQPEYIESGSGEDLTSNEDDDDGSGSGDGFTVTSIYTKYTTSTRTTTSDVVNDILHIKRTSSTSNDFVTTSTIFISDIKSDDEDTENISTEFYIPSTSTTFADTSSDIIFFDGSGGEDDDDNESTSDEQFSTESQGYHDEDSTSTSNLVTKTNSTLIHGSGNGSGDGDDDDDNESTTQSHGYWKYYSTSTNNLVTSTRNLDARTTSRNLVTSVSTKLFEGSGSGDGDDSVGGNGDGNDDYTAQTFSSSPFSRESKVELQEHHESDDFIFTNSENTPSSVSDIVTFIVPDIEFDNDFTVVEKPFGTASTAAREDRDNLVGTTIADNDDQNGSGSGSGDDEADGSGSELKSPEINNFATPTFSQYETDKSGDYFLENDKPNGVHEEITKNLAADAIIPPEITNSNYGKINDDYYIMVDDLVNYYDGLAMNEEMES